MTTWDPTTATNVALSDGNLTAINTLISSSADQGARVISTGGKTTGKYFFQITAVGGGLGQNVGYGVGTTASTYTAMGNNATTGVMCFKVSGNIYANGVNTGSTIGASNFGSVFGVAIDLDNRKAWFKRLTATPSISDWNGNPSANPATNVGGITIPAGTMVPFCTFGGTNGATGADTLTANFGATAFVDAVPPGFMAGWDVPVNHYTLPVMTGAILVSGPEVEFDMPPRRPERLQFGRTKVLSW